MSSVDLKSLHSTHSSLRENIIEHRLIADILGAFWSYGIVDVEILRSEFDAGGFDLVLSWRDIVRHIQLKAALVDGKRSNVSINMNLAKKPSGCVIWLDVNEALQIQGYRWHGGLPGEPLPVIGDAKIGKHTKGNSKGVKSDRPNHRIVDKKVFDEVRDIGGLIKKLVGQLQ